MTEAIESTADSVTDAASDLSFIARDAARAEANDRAAAEACFLTDSSKSDRGWESFKLERSDRAAAAELAAIGTDAADKQLASAAQKLDEASQRHEAAVAQHDDAQAAASVAERACEIDGEANWPAFKKALDRAEMRGHLVTLASRAVESAKHDHAAANAVADRERRAENMKKWNAEFAACITTAGASMIEVLQQLRIASKLMDRDSDAFHVRAWATAVQGIVRRSTPSQQTMRLGEVSDLALFQGLIADLV